MNTIKSVYYGWATLIVAGGGAYVFAKRSINADRAAKAEADRQKRIQVWNLEQQHLQNSPDAHNTSTTSQLLAASAPQSARSAGAGSGIAGAPGYAGGLVGRDDSDNPSIQANQDPAPTRHEPVGEAGKTGEKSKYEASEPYRTRKGDRFS